MSFIRTGLISLLLLSVTSASVAEEGRDDAASAALTEVVDAPAVVTRHHGVFNGQALDYTVRVEGLDVPGPEGEPAARIVSFSYLVDDVEDPSARPVLFLFNGGPIAPSLWLHMGSFGPKRIAFPDDLAADPSEYKLIDNAHSLLDVADLVFIDPASTGYSRVLPGVAPDSYFSVEADGQQIAAFIETWLAEHGRVQSPKYVFGESYGTNRAAEVASQLTRLETPILLDGVVLFGQALNIIEYAQRPANIISYTASLPTLAALAWHHKAIERRGRSLEAFVAEAERYAQDEYLTALYEGNAIGQATKGRVAERLEALSGISADYYLRNDLRITKEQFRRELLEEEGLLLGRADGRYVAALDDEDAADPSAVVRPSFEAFFRDYVRETLNVGWEASYLVDSPVKSLDGWDWGGQTPFSDWPYATLIDNLFEANPEAKVMVANGYFDTMTTIGAAKYLVTQSEWPADRTWLKYYRGGHMAYTNDNAAVAFSNDLRAFIRAE